MYRLIERFNQQVIAAIPPNDIIEYEWLLLSVQQANTPAYQRRYRNFWVMNQAQLSSSFWQAYFAQLSGAITQPPTLSSLCQTLAPLSMRRNGAQTLQFSFATKLLHTARPQFPIHDMRVAAFYFFEPPPTRWQPRQQMSAYLSFHTFLGNEYARVIKAGILTTAIQAFRQQFQPQRISDQKIVDWLIWAFVRVLQGGALLSGHALYS
jgi:hypothetical protein